MPFVHSALTTNQAGLCTHLTCCFEACDPHLHAGSLAQFTLLILLQDMSEWFPCWEEGLGLSNFTRKGWETTSEGKRYTGVNDECWWKPPAATCEDYYRKATDASGHAQPVPDEEEQEVAERHDEHDTAASQKWKKFYTQETGDIIYQLFKPDFLAFGYERATFKQ